MGVARRVRLRCSTNALSLFIGFSFFLVSPVSCQSITFSPQPSYDLAEEEPVGTTAALLEAFYLTPLFQLRTDGVFSLDESEEDAQYFTIETSRNDDRTANLGILRTAAVFDRDTNGAQFTFVVTVTYTTPDGTASTTAGVTILLLDINDNLPQFSSPLYSIAIPEATPPGSILLQVLATDQDQVSTVQSISEDGESFTELVYVIDNGRVLYDITTGNQQENFLIDSEEGAIILSPGAALNVDEQELYNLTVEARDGPGLTTQATVLISVLDSNDNTPEIISPRSLNVTLSEATPVGLVLIDSINATDGDRGLNGEIEFLIISGDATSSFSIDGGSGHLFLSSPLDREGGTGAVVNLTIAARDGGVPPLQDTISVLIFIEDVNDFAPFFTQEQFEGSVSEGSRSGLSVGKVEAEDGDEGPSGEIIYSIFEGGDGIFTIDPQTGEIFTNGTLDREERDMYVFTVSAVDNPINSSLQLSSSTSVTIVITDLNDNVPVFNHTYYEIHILDNLTRGDDVILIAATDSDEGVNAELTYQFADPLPDNADRFRIIESSGQVRVNRRPRIDIQSSYQYVVRAVDGGTPISQADTNLTIFIHDVDETPPTFEPSSYNTTLSEIIDVGSFVLQVSATDPDPGEIGMVRYRIVTEFDTAGSFAVDEETGAIIVASRLDYDVRNYTMFQVEAYDGGFPQPFTDLANITIFLLSENDEAPSIIFPDSYFPTVPENTPSGFEIVDLAQFTFDPDPGPGGLFEFALFEIYDPLDDGNASFSLSSSGLLTSLRPFDREVQMKVVVAIETVDYGDPPVSQVTNVTVVVGDRNDHAPFFSYNATAVAYELLPPGYIVLDNYTASDEDIGSNAELTYAIYAGDPDGEFSMDPQTGVLFTAAPLNKTTQLHYQFTILVLDRGSPQMTTFGYISVTVVDSNDQAPVFLSSSYHGNVSEAAPIGTLVVQVSATDDDVGTNSQLQYYIISFDGMDRFSIDTISGNISTIDIFDRENETNIFSFEVIAVDNGVIPIQLTGTATVTVEISDANDHSPQFLNSSYSTVVTENTAIGSFVMNISADDDDAEFPNNAIRFSLNGSRSDEFQIEPSSGTITVAGEVDWEEGEEVNIVVIATDQGNPPMSSTAMLTIFIEDINDRPPTFPPGSLNLGILENTRPPAVLGAVLAEDPDTGSGGLISFEVVLDMTGGRFQLNTSTGEVTFVRGTLNREQRPFYEMLIRALDDGVPQLSSEGSLIISVVDANDFAPIFLEPEFFGSVSENVEVGTTVLRLAALDSDEGSNAALLYSISHTHSSLFSVDQLTGDIFTISTDFNFEGTKIYSFSVFVTDQGEPPQNDTAAVTVEITDFNDNDPVFLLPEYSVVLEESLSPYTTVLQIAATDADSGDNAIIRYSLAGGNEGGGAEYFDVDPVTGVIYTTQFINREQTANFTLQVIANNSLSFHPLSVSVPVFVSISDISDARPSFQGIVTEKYVIENTAFGTVLFRLEAFDGDEGLDGVIKYSCIHGNEDGMFHLDEDTGDVMLTRTLDYEYKRLHNFVVMATDSSPLNLTNYTNVNVHVTDVNDNPPIFTSSNYTVTINSEVAVGTNILNMVAMDADSGTNAALTYSIQSGNELGLLHLQSPSQPSILTASPLQTYSGQTLTLTMEAQDPDHSAVAMVTVVIAPGLQGLPSFTATTFHISLPEATESGIVFELSSVAINYNSFSIEAGNEDGAFSVDEAGTVRLVGGSLNHETTPTHQLTVSAVGSAGDQAFAVLTVSVTDSNEFEPEFVSSSFLVHIPETTTIGVAFFAVIATDRDSSSPANMVEYSIVSGDHEALATFDMDPATGELSLQRGLDYEGGDWNFSLTISAVNSAASPSLQSETTVTIVIVNGNSHTPFFTSPISQFIVLPEDVETGMIIFNATAEDDDTELAGKVTFGLDGNHHFLDFSIDSFSGQIRVNSPLDFEHTIRYQLEVVVTDRGNPPLSSSSFLVVSIVDINDNSPKWEQELYEVSIRENSTVGVSVVQVLATDPDLVDFAVIDGERVFYNRNGYVSYSITAGDSNELFYIDPDTGLVSVAGVLDRETAGLHNLTLTATDGGGRAVNATLIISILDINDVAPTFQQSLYRVGIPEDAPNETALLTLVAFDYDLQESSLFLYDITSGNIDDTFAINSTTGEVWLDKGPLDRETISSYNLTVVAVDMGQPPLTGSTQLLVSVIDLNEFPPLFIHNNFSGEIAENASVLSMVVSLLAIDEDFGENATITYSIIEGNSNSRFEITMTTGEIYVADMLDFEENTTYELVVMATDSGPINSRLSSEVNVTIVILDVNDNPPLFTQDGYLGEVREDAASLSPILSMQAFDYDSGSNAQLLFSLPSQGSSGNFIVDPQAGIISLSLNASLDREANSEYSFIAMVTDLGDPPLSSTVDVVIVITDANDNAPLFDAPHYTASILENSPSETRVMIVTASDDDIEENAEITYSLHGLIETETECSEVCDAPVAFCQREFSNSSSSPLTPLPFTITNFTGVVETALPLDRENVDNYIIVIAATDLGNETRQTSFTCLDVVVLDVNDNVPVFSQDNYTTSISEYTGVGESVAIVTASDDDVMINGDVRYQLLSESGSFTVNSLTGEILSLGVYDREEKDSYNLTVAAVDQGAPSLSSTTVVMVNILDENDNIPTFPSSLFSASIAELSPPSSLVLQLQASDTDLGLNSTLRYVITDTLPENHFIIDSTTGRLETAVELDRESITSYLVTIFSTDLGNPPLGSSTQVNVTVDDVNDNAPLFSQESYFTEVEENSLPLSPLLTLSASDRDIGSNANITFNITDINPMSTAFSIDSISGVIQLVSPVDAEQSLSYSLTIAAGNGDALPPQTTEVTVLIAVGDINDHAPFFSQEDYVVAINELSTVGSEVIQLTVTDDDATSANSELTFALSGIENSTLFSIDAQTGVIFVDGALDREATPRHTLLVIVQDNGTNPGPLSAMTTVIVVLSDANDNAPVFSQSTYSFSLSENNDVAVTVGRVQASDPDINTVLYSIAPYDDDSSGASGSVSGEGGGGEGVGGEDVFTVSEETGEVRAAVTFDREQQNEYNFIVIATDNGTEVQRRSAVRVTVTIRDLNDKAPTFLQSAYLVDWAEDTTLGTVLVTVATEDGDLGDAGTVEYALLPSNDSPIFSIDPYDGNVTLKGALDRETQDQFVLEVLAYDLGEPSLTSTAVVTVNIQDVNDNIPVLNASLYEMSVSEDVPLPSFLLQVEALDEDIEENGEIHFSISDIFAGTFAIDEVLGIISLSGSIDFEQVHQYNFSVVAIDTGEPPLSSSAVVTITVLDVNDNAPVFQTPIFHTLVPENTVLSASLFQIPATDADATSNGDLRYSILSGNLGAVFALDETSGLLSLADHLDREVISRYSLQFRAVDRGSPQLTSTAMLEVEVGDINDHSPIFSSSTYSVSIPESTGLGMVIMTVSASDDDIGTNANLTYSIAAGDPEGNFYMDPLTGEISITRELDYETTPTYTLSLLVSDQGQLQPHISTAIISLVVTDTNEHTPTFPQTSFHLTLPSSAPLGSLLGVFPASDGDRLSGSTLSYSLDEGEGNSSFFSLDLLSASLHTASFLPPGELSFSLTTSDGIFASSLSVSVSVSPPSTPLPSFLPPALLLSPPEDSSVGDLLGTVQVETFQEVVFSLLSNPSNPVPFEVTPNGDIIMIGPLDYETTPTYIFTVRATTTDNSSLVANSIVTMVIEDINDNAPMFTSSDYYVVVPELTVPGSHLLSLTAFDLDTPGPNSEIQFSITEGNEEEEEEGGSLFFLDPSSGELMLTGQLDFESSPNVSLVVAATNHLASPPLSSQAVVTFELEDQNDHNPQFSQPYYLVTVATSATVGAKVLQLEASDEDSGSNAELSFSLTHLNLPLSFTINQTSGVVFIGSGFSGDQQSYIISAAVADHGAPQPLTDSTTIFVTVVPDNNFTPEFSEPGGYAVQVLENLPVGGPITQLAASDADNSVVTFSIVSGDPNEIFTIDPSTGLVSLLAPLDYQQSSLHQLLVEVEDAGIPSRTASVAVNISVTDVNDHAPLFSMESYEIEVLENVTAGSPLLVVTASDPDATSLTYLLTTNSYQDGRPLFSLNPHTGLLSTSSLLDRELVDTHTILVSAVDSGYSVRISSSAPVIIQLIDLNDTPPQFQQHSYTFDLIRYLASDIYIATVTATDEDLIGQSLEYSIVSDDSGGLFAIGRLTGAIQTTQQVPEASPEAYQLMVAVSDGENVTTVSVEFELTNHGDFCQDSGLCTNVRQVNCSFSQFGSCDPNILGDLYDPYCLNDYILSPQQYVCLLHSCLDSSLIPCPSSSSCLPNNHPCSGQCPTNTSLCPTTELCHMTSLQESCDASNTTCLIGQTLVQAVDGEVSCVSSSSSSLTPTGAVCSGVGLLFCEALDDCVNMSSSSSFPSPSPCDVCPPEMFLCPDTLTCATTSLQCCGHNEYFCDLLQRCLDNGEVCQLPNIAPVVMSHLIHVESLANFELDSETFSKDHIISQLLSNSSGMPAVDSQGEELSIAIVETSTIATTIANSIATSIATSQGEWQYRECYNSSTSSSSCESKWMRVGEVSEESALVLPSSAQLRFIWREETLEGAVWLRVKLWDGNEDGYFSPALDSVRWTTPFYSSTLPFSSTGAFSQSTFLISILLLPSLLLPQLTPHSSPPHLSPLIEDTLVVYNHGNTLQDLAAVLLTQLEPIATNQIAGFPELPDSLAGLYSCYSDLLSPSVFGEYQERVDEVNPIRYQREIASEWGQLPGMGIRLSNYDSGDGRWQVSWNGDRRLFVYLDTLLSTDYLLLLNTSARVRFVPSPDYCGTVSIPFQAWDGYWNETESTRLDGGFVVAMETSLSPYHLSSQPDQQVQQHVECVADKPVILVSPVLLDPIPYYLAYDYEQLFTLIVTMEMEYVREDRERLSELLQVILEEDTEIVRVAEAGVGRTQVSFRVEEDNLSYSNVMSLLMEKEEVLAALGFPVSNITQTSYYSPGVGCSSFLPILPHLGTAVTSLTSQMAVDRDGDTLGLAVTGTNSTSHGVWQYRRGNWDITNDTTSSPLWGPWINFPPNISPSKALLLSYADTFRFLPHPHSFWSVSPPSISVKTWDMSLLSSSSSSSLEAFLSSINTDTLLDTVQSLHFPVGLFSEETAVVMASRYGCNDVINSGLTFDPCCVCGGSGESCAGCDSVTASGKNYDSCDVCGGHGDCEGCDFVPFSGAVLGDCGECVSVYGVTSDEVGGVREEVSVRVVDCDGVCFGAAVTDECGVCSGGNTGHTYNIDIDCNGICFGIATLDSCGDCTGPGTMLDPEWNRDCTGVCGGPFRADSCGVCQLPSEGGVVTEHRDCLGVCFGEAELDECGNCNITSSSSFISLDVCGVCDGDNSTCDGCDGVPASDVIVDSCGVCGGNDCSCFMITSISPQWGPKSGGTEVLIQGAGFFLNDSSALDFDFDPQSENCGAPFTHLGGEGVAATCRFQSGENDDIIADDVIIFNQSTIRCVTKATTTDLLFTVSVAIETSDFSNGIQFRYYDDDKVFVSEITPFDTETNQETTVVRFHGLGFINTQSLVCLILEPQSCGLGSAPLVIPANYLNETQVSCLLPAASTPCQMQLQLSLDGQTSGVVAPNNHIFTFRASAPTVEEVYFSSDLASLIILFDRSVELAGAMTSDLNCSSIFSPDTLTLLGGIAAECCWASSDSCIATSQHHRQLKVSLPPTALLKVTSLIAFQEGAMVTSDESYSYAISSEDQFPVDVDPDSILPVVVVNGPHSIAVCGSIQFIAVHSLYAGYSGLYYQWSMVTEDSTTHDYSLITDYLDSLEPTDVSVSFQSEWFGTGTEYYLQLVVMNSVGVVSSPAVLRLVREEEEEVRPQLVLLGEGVREIEDEENVIVKVTLYIPHCDVTDYQFQFLWQLYELTDVRRGLTSLVDTSSLPTSSPILLLPSSLLTPTSTYIARVTASAASYTESLNVSITVATTSLLATIHGGDRVVSTNRTLVLDARPSSSPAHFSWACSLTNSGDPCYNASLATPTPLILPDMDLVSIPGHYLDPGQSYNFTVSVFHTEGGISQDSVVVQMTDAMPPIVEVRSEEVEVVESGEVVLRGLVYSGTPVTSVSWESVRIEGHGYLDLTDPSLSLSQTSYPPFSPPSSSSRSSLPSSIAPSQTSWANLVLPPHTLTPLLPYTFRLTAQNDAGTASAQLSLTSDPLPHSFSLSIFPTTGVSLETTFALSVEGGLDSYGDSPFLYQFGLLGNGDEILWLSGQKVERTIHTILPSGSAPTYNVTVLVRVFDRHGGFSEDTATTTILPSSASTSTIQLLLQQLEVEYSATRDWETLLHNLVSISMEIGSAPSLQQKALSLFLQVFPSAVPASSHHYDLAAGLLILLAGDDVIPDNLTRLSITTALTEVASWYQRETAIYLSPWQPLTGAEEEPLQLLPPEEPSYSSNLLSMDTLERLVSVWSRQALPQTTPPGSTGSSLTEGLQTLSLTVCQERVYGEDPVVITSSAVEVVVHKAAPLGWFSVGGAEVGFGVVLQDAHRQQACSEDTGTCLETCFQGAKYSLDLFNDYSNSQPQALQLSASAEELINTEIARADPQAVELISDIIAVAVSIPAQKGYLMIDNLPTALTIHLPLRSAPPTNQSLPLCLSRPLGGAHGFTNTAWQLDSLSSPQLVVEEDTMYFICESYHLSQFAVGLLPPPTPPIPTSSPPPSPSSTSTRAPETKTQVTMETPTIITNSVSSGPAAAIIIIPILLIIVIICVVAMVIIIILVWRKKRSGHTKIVPEGQEGPSHLAGTDGGKAELVRAGPLTPEESKIPMQVIQLLDDGVRSVVGTMSVLPSIRLRELRHQIGDTFASFGNKPFYFLTRQLVDVEPPSEQQQFVSLVYGQTPDKPIFLRKVTTTSDLTRLHFCVCGNASQFECSSCSAQGYCSPECQAQDWGERHQRECGRLGERKHRMSVLRRQMTLSPIDEHPRSLTTAPLPPVTGGGGGGGGGPSTAPTDFRSLLNSQRSFQRPPLTSSLSTSLSTPPPHSSPPPVSPQKVAGTTLGMLASQRKPPTQTESTREEEGEEEEEGRLQLSSRSIPRQTGRMQLPPLTSTPAQPLLTSPSPLSPLSTSFTRPLAPSQVSHSLSPPPPHTLPTSTPHTTPASQLLFQRSQFQHTSPRQPVSMINKQLSIQSVGSEDLTASLSSRQPPPPGLRRDAHLEPDRSESTTSESETDSESDSDSDSEDEQKLLD